MTTAGDKRPRKDPEQIKNDIERTRTELGDTVDQLADKLDVKTRARQQAAATSQRAYEMATMTTQRARGQYERLRADRGPAPVGAAAALLAVGAVVALAVWRRRR